MPFRGRVGLSKEQVRRIVLAKLRIVYRDWRLTNRPFGRRDPNAGRRREDAQSFETALVAALVGGLSEAIEKNNEALFTALGRKDRRMRRKVQAQRRKRELVSVPMPSSLVLVENDTRSLEDLPDPGG